MAKSDNDKQDEQPQADAQVEAQVQQDEQPQADAQVEAQVQQAPATPEQIAQAVAALANRAPQSAPETWTTEDRKTGTITAHVGGKRE